MVKDIKYIIKRILISVGVILLLSFLRGNLFVSASALEPINVTPNGVCWNEDYDDHSCLFQTPTAYSHADQTMYGYTFGADGNLAEMVWRYQGSNLGGKYYDIDLLYYIGADTTYLDSTRGFIKNHNGNIFSCSIDNTRWGTIGSDFSNTGAYGLASVHCSNVYLNDNYFNFYVTNLLKKYNAVYSVSVATLTPISDDNENTENIIDNQNENTDRQIENQNQNTEKEIESQKVCTNRSLTMNKILFDNSSSDTSGYLNSSGAILNNVNWKVTDYISLDANQSYSLSGFVTWSTPYYCIYDENEHLESCSKYSTQDQSNFNTILSFATNKKVRFSYSQAEAFNVTFSGKFCSNGNQAIADSNKELNDTLKDDSGGEVSSSWFDDFQDTSTSPVSDLLTMPITLMQAYLEGFNGNCQSINLGRLYGSYLVIPCINLRIYLGDDLWSLIDVLFSLFMLYNIGMLCVSIYEGITSLEDDMQMLYSPRHAGAGDTRVERYGD